MYIMIKKEVPLKFIPVICAHASLSAYLNNQEDPYIIEWLEKSFKKVVCEINEKEFNKIKNEVDRIQIITESGLDNQEVAIVVLPRPNNEFPNVIKFAKLWRNNEWFYDKYDGFYIPKI